MHGRSLNPKSFPRLIYITLAKKKTMSISYCTIQHDIFFEELSPSVSNNQVIFVPTGNKPSIEIFIEQMGRINHHLLKGSIPNACNAGLKTVSSMKALRFAKSAHSSFLIEVGKAVSKQAIFVEAVDSVASAMKSSPVNQYLCSAASKILQGFPQYAGSVFIYDDVVARELKVVPVTNGSARLFDFNQKFNSALSKEKIDNAGHLPCFLSVKDFINQESKLINSFSVGHAQGCLKSISKQDWEDYVERRTLDRILWLKRAAIDLATKNGISLSNINYQICTNQPAKELNPRKDGVVSICPNC